MSTPSNRATTIKAKALSLAVLVVALDQWSKWLIERDLERFDSITVIPGFFSLLNVRNTGIAFGLLPSHGSLWGTAILIVLGLVALGVVTYYFLRAPTEQVLLLLALALVMGGAVGNLIDRVMLGAVTDFLDVYVGEHHWPTFNVADSAISIGIALLAIETLLPFRGSPEEKEAETEAANRSFERKAVGAE